MLNTINEKTVRLLAALAEAHPHTARRFLQGAPIRGNALRERLTAALPRVEQMLCEREAPSTPDVGPTLN